MPVHNRPFVAAARKRPVDFTIESGFPYGHDQWISAAGAGWAAMALSLAEEPPKAETGF